MIGIAIGLRYKQIVANSIISVENCHIELEKVKKSYRGCPKRNGQP